MSALTPEQNHKHVLKHVATLQVIMLNLYISQGKSL